MAAGVCSLSGVCATKCPARAFGTPWGAEFRGGRGATARREPHAEREEGSEEICDMNRAARLSSCARACRAVCVFRAYTQTETHRDRRSRYAARVTRRRERSTVRSAGRNGDADIHVVRYPAPKPTELGRGRKVASERNQARQPHRTRSDSTNRAPRAIVARRVASLRAAPRAKKPPT